MCCDVNRFRCDINGSKSDAGTKLSASHKLDMLLCSYYGAQRSHARPRLVGGLRCDRADGKPGWRCSRIRTHPAAVSRRLAALEAKTGVTLAIRTTRGSR